MVSPHKLLATAARLHATGDTALVGAEVRDFALTVLELLGEDQPCGYEPPESQVVYSGGRPFPAVIVPRSWTGPADLDDVRAMVRMLLVALDEAEALPRG